ATFPRRPHTLPACAARESPGGSLALQEDGGRLGLECERRSEDTLDRDLRALSRRSAFFAHDDQRTRPVINLVGSGPENADRACDIAGDPDRLSVKLPRVVEKCLDRCGTLATRKHHEGGRDQDSWGERTDRVSRWLHTSSSGRRAADHFFLPRNYLRAGVSQPIQNLQVLPGGTPASTLPLSGQARRSRPRRTGRHERPKRLLFRFLQLLFTPWVRLARPLRANRPVRFIVPLFITMRFAHRPGRARVRPGSCRLLGRTMYETDIPWWDAEAGK